MQYWVYVLISESTGKLVCGQTTDLAGQLKSHNEMEGEASIPTVKKNGPWGLLWLRECESRFDAKKLEKSIKNRGIGCFIFEHEG